MFSQQGHTHTHTIHTTHATCDGPACIAFKELDKRKMAIENRFSVLNHCCAPN
jgi:hypothetical protein